MYSGKTLSENIQLNIVNNSSNTIKNTTIKNEDNNNDLEKQTDYSEELNKLENTLDIIKLTSDYDEDNEDDEEEEEEEEEEDEDDDEDEDEDDENDISDIHVESYIDENYKESEDSVVTFHWN